MATLGLKGKVTLLDWANSTDPDGKTATVVELLGQTNEILTDMSWIEGNLPTGHQTVIRTGLPVAVFRKLYGGVPPSKGNRAKVVDTCGMLESRAEVDKDVIELNGNTASFRLSEAESFLETMNQTMAQTLIYGDTGINPERFTGLTPRYNTLSALEPVSQNVIDGGGTGTDNSSVWLVVWGNKTVHGIFPKGSKAGIQHEDLGLIDAFDGNGDRFRAYADHWQWKCGVAVEDWRYVVRICNIDISDLVAATGTQANAASTSLIKLMMRALARIPAMGRGTPVFYCNRTVKEFLSINQLDRSQNALSIRESFNQLGDVTAGSVATRDLVFQGVPIRLVDQILSTEARVT